MNSPKRYGRHFYLIIGSLVLLFTTTRLSAALLNSVQNPNIIHTVLGTDKFYTKKKNKGEIKFHFSPFFQHAGAARDKSGRVTPIGDRLGKWNMLGLFFGRNAAPKVYTSYPNLYQAYQNIHNLPNIYTNLKDYTDETKYDPDKDTDGSFNTVDCTYEKLGVRSQLTFDFGFGLGLGARFGVADHRQTASFAYPVTAAVAAPAAGSGDSGGSGGTPTTPATASTLRTKLYEYLMSPQARNPIFQELGLDVNEVRKTTLEDTQLYLSWTHPFDLKEKSELTVTMAPYLSLGLWLPTGSTRNQQQAFATPSGNDGIYGASVDGSFNFDFPGMVQVGFGGGALISSTKDFKNYRVPSSLSQNSIYPWTTSISKRPGITWYANVSLKAENFIPDMGIYFDYIYSYHEKDAITLKESDQTRAATFANGLPHLVEESNWKAQQFNLGLSYRVTPVLGFGAAVQSLISGVRVYKATTVMGSMVLTF
jgi:hypothetical protein